MAIGRLVDERKDPREGECDILVFMSDDNSNRQVTKWHKINQREVAPNDFSNDVRRVENY